MPDLSTAIRDIESIVQRDDHSRIDDLIAWLAAGSEDGDCDAWLGRNDATTDERLAWAAAWVLGCLGAERAVPALEELLHRHRYHSSPGAAVALLKIGPDKVRKRTIISIVKNWGPLRVGLGCVGRQRRDLLPLVQPFCRSFDPRIRHGAREFVNHNTEPEATGDDWISASPDQIATWLNELDTSNRDVIGRAGQKLSRCESLPPAAVSVLVEAMVAWRGADIPYNPALSLLIALARTGDPAGMEPLLDRLDDLNARPVTAHAIDILLNSSAADVATDVLARLLKVPDGLLCIMEDYDLNWSCHKDITDIDFKPTKELAAAELVRRGVVCPF